MANLQDILQSAQGGKAAQNLAQRFGISTEQASSAIEALVPALATGLQQALKNPGSLSGLLGQLSAGLHQSSFQNADSAHSDAAISGGSSILSQILGDPSVVGQIAQQASRITGLRPDLLARMAPVVATMAAGGLMSSLKSQGFSNILGELAGKGGSSVGGGAPASGGLAGLFTSVMGLFGMGTGKGGSGGSGGQSGLDALKEMLQPGKVDPQHQAAIGHILNRRV